MLVPDRKLVTERTPVAAVALVLALLLVPVFPFGWGSALSAQEGGELEPQEGPECCLLLLVPVGARASAMGGAITARTGVESTYGNPAGLAGLEGSTFVIHHSDISENTQVDAFSLVLTPWNVAFGLSYQLFDKGEITTTDVFGQPTGELVLRDHLITASFATPLGPGLSAGLNYRLFQQRIDCNGQCGGEESVATTNAIDAGVQYRPAWHPPLELGLAVVNAGPGLQVVNAEQADPLPGRIHLGATYDLLATYPTDHELALRLAADVRDVFRDPGSPTVAFGLELDVQQAVFLRAGYAPGEGLGTGAGIGVELRYDRFDVAVARSFVNSQLGADTEPFQVSFGLNF